MQFFTVNITRVVRPRVTNTLDLRYFCQHNSSFYHLNLIPCHYWSWQSHIYILVNTFVRHTFPLSNSSIKTETVLTMTDMTESTELRAFKRMVKKFNSKSSKILLASDYEICMVCLLVGTVYRQKSLEFVKISNITLLSCLFMILLAVSMITLCSTTF